jgi:nicotinamidase-related amidase
VPDPVLDSVLDHHWFIEEREYARHESRHGRSDLPRLLAERDIETIVVTGTLTNVCVEHTVRDASAPGLRAILVADACAATRDADLNATLHVVYRSYGDVRPTAEVLGLISASSTGG